ncbi:MAG TPA: VRR-NUC domain-containing protein [Polyangiaceae bacterium]|nr:VRR-NUC domain-containing protein [Polyangiaceae bacterium]
MSQRRLKPETSAQAKIVEALRAIGRVVHRVHCGTTKVRRGYMQHNEKGTPDLHVVPCFYLETKSASGELSDDQKRVHDKLRAQGGIVAVVRSAAEALAVVVGKVRPEDLETAEVRELLGEKPAKVKKPRAA